VAGGLGVSGKKPEYPVLSWPGSMDVGELLSYQVSGAGRAGDLPLIRVGVTGPESLHPTCTHSRAPSFLMSPGVPASGFTSLPEAFLGLSIRCFFKSEPLHLLSPHPGPGSPRQLEAPAALCSQPAPVCCLPPLPVPSWSLRWWRRDNPGFSWI
jgi:hypothetical protein